MPRTLIDGDQIEDGTIYRLDHCTQVAGKAVITKVIAGANIALAQTGIDAGTGDVTIGVSPNPAVRVSPSATQTIPSGANTRLNFGTKSFDPLSAWTTATSRYTAPTAGVYAIDLFLKLNNTTAGQIMIYKNGVLFGDNLAITTVATAFWSASDQIQLVATDYIEIYANWGTNNRVIQIADSRLNIRKVV